MLIAGVGERGGLVLVMIGGRVLQEPQTPFERYNRLFEEVPLLGGKEWQTASIDELVTLHQDACAEIFEGMAKERATAQAEHDRQVREHGRLSLLGRGWHRWWHNWKEPEVPEETTRAMIYEWMAHRCRSLANWMEAKQHQPFFAGSDMAAFIDNPRDVADRLDALAQAN